MSVQLGVGNHYGWAGARVALRPNSFSALSVGLGAFGASAAARFYPLDLLFVEAGFSPLLANSFSDALYGPDLSAGVDLTRSRFSLTAQIGTGLVTPQDPVFTLGLGLGVNLGRRHEAQP